MYLRAFGEAQLLLLAASALEEAVAAAGKICRASIQRLHAFGEVRPLLLAAGALEEAVAVTRALRLLAGDGLFAALSK
jgi:hypothetical protein